MYLVLTGETAMEGPEECRLEGEDGVQVGSHTQTCYWTHKVSVLKCSFIVQTRIIRLLFQ